MWPLPAVFGGQCHVRVSLVRFRFRRVKAIAIRFSQCSLALLHVPVSDICASLLALSDLYRDAQDHRQQRASIFVVDARVFVQPCWNNAAPSTASLKCSSYIIVYGHGFFQAASTIVGSFKCPIPLGFFDELVTRASWASPTVVSASVGSTVTTYHIPNFAAIRSMYALIVLVQTLRRL